MIQIWYGSYPSEKIIQNWRNWIKQNPAWKTYVIYDSSLIGAENKMKFENLAKDENFMLLDSQVFFEPDPYSEIHTAGPFPNYARRSDRDRLKALLVLGGIYMDAGDVTPIPNTHLPTPMSSEHGILFNHTSKYFNTDIIAATKGNQYLKELYEAMEDHDLEFTPPSQYTGA